MGFQTQIHINPAQGVPGDFASVNPMVYQLAGEGAMVADSSGVTIGTFAVLNAAGTVTSLPSAAPTDSSRIMFVKGGFNAQIVTWLAESSMTIQAGQPVEGYVKGDFYAKAGVIGGSGVRGESILWNITDGTLSVGGTASSTLLDTGYKLVTETATAGQTVIISNLI